MTDLQRAPQRYYQRPDAPQVSFDPTRTSLSGYAGRVNLNRNAGVWQVNAALWGVSPGIRVERSRASTAAAIAPARTRSCSGGTTRRSGSSAVAAALGGASRGPGTSIARSRRHRGTRADQRHVHELLVRGHVRLVCGLPRSTTG